MSESACPYCGQCGAHTCPGQMRALREELADEERLREKLADLLKRTAIAMKGPEPPLIMWDWSDLPEGAAILRKLALAFLTLIDAGAIDCGDNSCLYAKHKGGIRTNGGCRCFEAKAYQQGRDLNRALAEAKRFLAKQSIGGKAPIELVAPMKDEGED